MKKIFKRLSIKVKYTFLKIIYVNAKNVNRKQTGFVTSQNVLTNTDETNTTQFVTRAIHTLNGRTKNKD